MFIDLRVTKKPADAQRFSGDLGRFAVDLPPASHQGTSKVIPPSPELRRATFRVSEVY